MPACLFHAVHHMHNTVGRSAANMLQSASTERLKLPKGQFREEGHAPKANTGWINISI